MDFNLSETQGMLRDTLRRYLADKYDHDSRMKVVHSDAGWSQATWKAFAEELGILAAPFSEDLGGLGGTAVDNMIVMEELGGKLVIEPYLSTVVIGGGFARETGNADLVGKIIAGEVTTALAAYEPKGRFDLGHVQTSAKPDGEGFVLNGDKAVVRDAPFASHLFVTARTPGGLSLFLVDASTSGIVRRDYPTVDGSRASEIHFDGVRVASSALVGAEGQALPLVEKIIDEATAAVCAEAVGVMRQLHAQTLDYAKQRKQFGRPISDFQVIQHRLVDMFLEVEQAASMTLMATLKLDLPDAERKAAVSAAKARIGKGLKAVGQDAIQIHGGMGMTLELAVGHYFKRATMIESQFGSVDHHLARYEALTLSDAA